MHILYTNKNRRNSLKEQKQKKNYKLQRIEKLSRVQPLCCIFLKIELSLNNPEVEDTRMVSGSKAPKKSKKLN